jgi:hypothetical protein
MRVFTYILILIAMLQWSCTTEIVDPEVYGSIEGMVIKSTDDTPMSGVNIETSPATEVLLTDEAGAFSLPDVPTGSYHIKASKPGYKSKSVTVMVREDRTVTAKIILEPDEDSSNQFDYFESEILSWQTVGASDSVTVEIDYRTANTSEATVISEYEIYFDIYTTQKVVNVEVNGTQLDAGEQNYEQVRKYVGDTAIDSVTISGTWVKE